MKKKRWPWVVSIFAILAVAAGWLIWPSLNQVPVYETFEVKPTAVTKTVSANGQLAETRLLAYGPSEEPILISKNGSLATPAQFGAILEIKKISVKLGEKVSKNDLLFTFVNPLGQDVKVKALASGTVRSLDSLGGLRTSGQVLTIGSNKPIVSVFVSEYDADLVELGQQASIELDAINAVFTGEVINIGQAAQSLSGIKQYEVLLEVSTPPTGAKFGMSATAEISVLTTEPVLSVPLSAILGTEDPEVEILRTDDSGNQTVERVAITLGRIGDSFAEVVAGLKDGDLVVTGISGTIPAPINFGPPPGVRQSGP